MPAFKKDELIAASELRTLSQRHLFQTLEAHKKLGILYRDKLAAVMLPYERYELLLERISELEHALQLATDTKG